MNHLKPWLVASATFNVVVVGLFLFYRADVKREQEMQSRSNHAFRASVMLLRQVSFDEMATEEVRTEVNEFIDIIYAGRQNLGLRDQQWENMFSDFRESRR